MRATKIAIVFIILFLSSLTYSTTLDSNTCIYFFYGNGCSHCAKIEPYLNELELKYENLEIQRFEIYSNRENASLLNKYFDSYNIPIDNRGIPVIFISNKHLLGNNEIEKNLEKEIIKNQGSACPVLKENAPKLSELSLLTIIGAAFVDSINPCAIAVLLILLGALIATGDKKRALKAGIAFTVSIYLAYFLFGLGLFSALQITGISFWFFKAIGILAIIIGLANLKDFFWYGAGGFVMEVPRSWRPKLKSILSNVTSPFGAFLTGFIVCLFELPCTGGPYIVILGLLAEKMTLFDSIPLLGLYNLVFVLPLITLTLAIYFGFANTEKTNEWKEKNLRNLHLIAGIIMLVLGLAITTGLI